MSVSATASEVTLNAINRMSMCFFKATHVRRAKDRDTRHSGGRGQLPAVSPVADSIPGRRHATYADVCASRVRAAFFAAMDLSAGPLVLTAFRAAAERS